VRISRDEQMVRYAVTTALRGTCSRLSVGAVAARQGRPIATGYVGSPPGHPHCIDSECRVEDGHCINTSHAEENLFYFAARHGIALDGADLFITHSPCKLRCVKAIISTGIRRVVYVYRYKDATLVDEILRQAGIQVEWFKHDIDQSGAKTTAGDPEPEVQAVPPPH
jgi:dCMP deaminase